MAVMKIVCLGDSLTAGIEKNDPDNWVRILEREAFHTYINKGICGDTTGGMLARMQKDVVEEQAKSVIIMGGGNDFIVGCDIGTVKANIMAMVHQAYYNNIIPVVGVPVLFDQESIQENWAKFSDFTKVAEQYKQYREWIGRFSETFHVSVLDFQKAFEEKVTGEWKDYFSDGLHPNRKGNRIMADVILKLGM